MQISDVVDHICDRFDLSLPFVILSFSGALLAIFVMQQTWHDAASQTDSSLIQWSRRISFMVVALALVWRPAYLNAKHIQPDPTELLLLIGLNLIWINRAVILFSHRFDIRIERHRRSPQTKAYSLSAGTNRDKH